MDNNSTSLSVALKQHELLVKQKLKTSPKTSSSERLQHTNRLSNHHYSNRRNSDEHFDKDGMGLVNSDVQHYTQERSSCDTAQKLLDQIYSKDAAVRNPGLQVLSHIILSYIHMWHASSIPVETLLNFPLSQPRNATLNQALDEVSEQDSREEFVTVSFIQQVLASLLRLSICCPFHDVRHHCKQILATLQVEQVKIPFVSGEVSQYIPNEKIPPVDTSDEQTYSLYTECFVHNCRLEHMVMVMSMHPRYVHLFWSTNYHLLHSKGMLPHHYRSYIAIMAAARHKCSYLLRLMESYFVLQGGDREWLRGLKYAPPKLRALSTLNKLLAHRPWLVKPSHVKELVDCCGEARWQHTELAQAIVLLCHFHSVALFCLGTGVNLEIDHEVLGRDLNNLKTFPSHDVVSAAKSSTENPSNGNHIEVLMERMKKLGEEEEEEVTREEMNRRFEQEKEEASQNLLPVGVPTQENEMAFSKYIVDPHFSYQDFAKRDGASNIPTFRGQDYNWDDHAFLMVSNYYSEVADLLDEKFKTAHDLTYHTLGSKADVDTSSLRRAIWKYVHCMYGIMYDDYNYGEVNQLLDRPLKIFIKTVSCFPEKTSKTIYDGFWQQFRHSEKVHVTMMVMESRLQVGLMYGMRALTQIVSGR